jgi:hypothetical protein
MKFIRSLLQPLGLRTVVQFRSRRVQAARLVAWEKESAAPL